MGWKPVHHLPAGVSKTAPKRNLKKPFKAQCRVQRMLDNGGFAVTTKTIGYFTTPEEAHQAYREFRRAHPEMMTTR